MGYFFQYAFLFFLGSMVGWCMELVYRRIFSAKKWINPGFLNGPYLPIYGSGVCIMYGICSVPVPLGWKIVLIFAMMTLIEYFTGLIFIKGMGIKLWDYSKQPGNIQGIVCPLFSVIWGALGVAFLFLVYPVLGHALAWLSGHMTFLFVLGLFYGVFVIDVCVSFNLSFKIKRAAKKFQYVVRYEQLKVRIRAYQRKIHRRSSFLFPFRSDKPLSEHIGEYVTTDALDRAAQQLRAAADTAEESGEEEVSSSDDNTNSAKKP